MAEFKRSAAKEAAAIARGTVTKEEIERRGGINASGYFGDSFDPNTSLSDAEYAAAVAGKTGEAAGKAVNLAIKNKGLGITGQTGTVGTGTKTDEEIAAAEEAAATKIANSRSAYDLLFEKFNELGMGSLVTPLKGFIQEGLSDSEFTLRLRDTDAYKKRFAANAQRVAKGLRALSEAEYIGKEDAYQDIMRRYGLPESYYTRGEMGRQEGFEKIIANDISDVELEDRIATAQKRVLNANPEVIQAIKQFYPDITNADILAYTLDPKNAIENIKRKVTAAEIGGAQIGAGLAATAAGAESLANAGVTGQRYQQAASTIAEDTLRGGQLAAIYKQDPYTQQTAEANVLNIPGSAAAKKQTEKLKSLEEAAFSGRAGAGAIARDRAGVL